MQMLKTENFIPQFVKPNESIRHTLKVNRYQCNTGFYVAFLEELGSLELWDQREEINKIYGEVLEIEKLTIRQNENSDNNLSETIVRDLTEKINTALVKLNTERVKPIMQICDGMNGESLSWKVLSRLQKTISSGKYEEVLRRIWISIHNKDNRTDAILLVGILELTNGQDISKLSNSYHHVIQKSLNELKNFKGLIKQLNKNIQDEIFPQLKFRLFVQGIIKLYGLTNRLYEVIKLLEGQSNYKFKLNTLKTEVNNVIGYLNMRIETNRFTLEKFKLIEDDTSGTPQKISEKWYILSYKQYLMHGTVSAELKIKEGVCAFCLTDGEMVVSSHKKRVHLDCWNWLRSMST